MLSMVMTMDMDMDVDGDGPEFGHVDGFDSTSPPGGPRASTGRAAGGGDGRAASKLSRAALGRMLRSINRGAEAS